MDFTSWLERGCGRGIYKEGVVDERELGKEDGESHVCHETRAQHAQPPGASERGLARCVRMAPGGLDIARAKW